MDFRRAFETVDRAMVFKKLKGMYNIDGNVLVYEWSEDYLEDRYQKIRFNNSVLKELQVDYGVPQGSKLG